MRVAYYALHYGREYLAHSIRSVQDAVDEIFIYYAKDPSYGFRGAQRCPETRAQLWECAHRFATKPVRWMDGSWRNEGEHRDFAIGDLRRRGASMVLVVDSDEVWAPDAASAALDYARTQDRAGRWMMPFTNFWRSFQYIVRDHFTPIRVVDLRHSLTVDAMVEGVPPVLHFGYAQSEALMAYKWTCHGHQRELRQNWMRDKFLAWQPGMEDLHPCIKNFWVAESTPPEVQARIDAVLHDHQYRGIPIIR